MADFSGVLSVPHIGRGRSVEPLSTWLLKSSKARVMGGPWTGGRWASSSLRCFQGECTPTSLGSAIPLLPLTLPWVGWELNLGPMTENTHTRTTTARECLSPSLKAWTPLTKPLTPPALSLSGTTYRIT
jgi:hypothetical protein